MCVIPLWIDNDVKMEEIVEKSKIKMEWGRLTCPVCVVSTCPLMMVVTWQSRVKKRNALRFYMMAHMMPLILSSFIYLNFLKGIDNIGR